MADTTTKYGLPFPEGAVDTVKLGAGAIQDLAEDVDSKFAGYSEGPFSSRPTSTPGTPGIAGRVYRATDTGVIYHDNGTGWDTLVRALAASQTWNPAAIANGSSETLFVPVTGAAVGQVAAAGLSSMTNTNGLILTATVAPIAGGGAGVLATLLNFSGSSVNLLSGTLVVRVFP